jgi:hypothetical protein
MRAGLLLTCLLSLSACAIIPSAAPPSGPGPVPADSVVLLAPGTPPSADASTVAVFTPSREFDALSDTELLKQYAPQAGRRGANHVSVLRVDGRRMVRAYYLRIPPLVATAVPADSADAPRSSGGSSASSGTGGSVHVRGYYRRDGTYVRPHTRSRPGSARSGGSRRRN